MEKKSYTIIAFTENHTGLLNHVTIVFTRRKINIESITASESQIPGVHSLTIVIQSTRDQVEKLTKQLERLVEVSKAFFYEEDQVVTQEIALYKLPIDIISRIDIGQLLRNNNARILDMEAEFLVIERTGTKEETQALLEHLRPLGLLEFNRSGRVVVSRPMKTLEAYLDEKQAAHRYSL